MANDYRGAIQPSSELVSPMSKPAISNKFHNHPVDAIYRLMTSDFDPGRMSRGDLRDVALNIR